MGRTVRRASAYAVLVAMVAACATLLPVAPAAAVSTDVVISEVYGGGGNSGATLTNDFIELYNRSAEDVPLDRWSVQYASATGNFTQVTPLTGTIPADGHYLVQEAAGAGGTVPLPDPDAAGSIPMSGTSGKVILVQSTVALGCGAMATPCSAAQLAQMHDLVGYGSSANLFEGPGPTATLSNTTSASRSPAGTDTDSNVADFTVGTPDPQTSTDEPPPPPPPSGCETPATHQIAEVQGDSTATPLAGQAVRVEGVVTGDFQASGQLGGFFIQDDTPDDNPLTSDGVFVASDLPASVGDRVLVNGTAIEAFGLTELSPVTAVDVCGTGTISPEAYDLPRPSGTTFEPVEGVLLTFPEPLTATEHFQLGRFGEVTVSSDGRLFQPTDRVDPGPPAQALLEEADRRRLLIDDGSNVQNPPTVPFVAPGDALRIGDQASNITGVLSFGFSRYRLQPTAPITFARTNPRPAAPDPVGGDVQVASFNALNYFTTLGSENPDARGADTEEEFARQQAKLVAAILGLDADVLGLMEVENNGTEAIGSLVDALNAASAPGTYAFVVEPFINPPNEFGGTFGTDAIKVAFIYKPAVVAPVGPAQTSTDPVFSRPPLIQTFEPVAGGEQFTLVVNHFKSKNCGGATGADEDQVDGQACFNALRVAQASTLAAVIDELDLPNTLIIGDLNAYTEEDPIHTLEAAGYTGLSELFIAEDDRYSFVFDGFSGELDHAMAAPDVLDNVTGATIWHINADEPLILDYNTEFNPPGLYQPDAYRASDHDPLLIGLSLDIDPPAAPAVSVLAGWGAATVSWTAPADGGSPITGYTVRALAGTTVVASASLGPSATSHTFGQLANGVLHTFEVVATNAAGDGPAGTATATPFVPGQSEKLVAGVSCPSFTARNPNAFPVSIRWVTNRRQSGLDVVPANATIILDSAAPRGTVLTLYAGDTRRQDTAPGRC